MEDLSQHCTFNEATKSKTAKKYKISNNPSDVHIKNMKRLLNNIFEPLRTWTRKPIKINSFYRSKTLNGKLKGSSTSQHLCINNSAAIDIDSIQNIADSKTNYEMAMWIMDNVKFDQLILEDVNIIGHPEWIHVSLKKSKNRGEVLIMKRDETGKVFYMKYDDFKYLLDLYPARRLLD